MTTRFAADGRKVSLLGYGAMRLPTVDGGHANGWAKDGYSESGIDQKLLDAQVKYMLDHGVNYFDTSPAYCRGDSEACLGRALKASGYARGDYVVATKLSNFAPQQYPLDECRKMFEKSLEFLQTDYIDNYLLHSVGNGGFKTFSQRYLENGALDWCVKLREEKRIRNLGFSFHGDPKVFEWCLERHGEYKWDFCQIQMNYVDWLHAKAVNERNLDAKYLYERLTELKIPIVVMEPLLGGRLARYNYALARELAPLDPEASLAKWALRFCGRHLLPARALRREGARGARARGGRAPQAQHHPLQQLPVLHAVPVRTRHPHDPHLPQRGPLRQDRPVCARGAEGLCEGGAGGAAPRRPLHWLRPLLPALPPDDRHPQGACGHRRVD